MNNLIALVHGIYFFITGICPILSMRTFLLITGPKTDLWLVKTVRLILATIGGVLIFAQVTATVNPAVILLAVGAALSLILVEVIYVVKRVISTVYLVDECVELVLIVWWVISIWFG